MTKTKLTNGTKVEITLKEGTAGILRKICDIQPDRDHVLISELNQTYKEYWCIGMGSDLFTLSSDDLLEWKEIKIQSTSDGLTKFHWRGITPRKNQGIPIASPSETPPPPQAHSSSLSKPGKLSKLGNKIRGWMNIGPKPSGSTEITDPATTTTTTETPDSARDTSTCVAPMGGAPPAAAPTTVTITSTTPSTSTTETATTTVTSTTTPSTATTETATTTVTTTTTPSAATTETAITPTARAFYSGKN